MNAELLKELGLDAAAEKVTTAKELKRKLMIAYEKYKVVSPDAVQRFQERIYEKTKKEDGYSITYDRLVFIELKDYREVPPMDCLMDLQKAKAEKIFDAFEVAKIEAVVQRKDPIIFGKIDGCVDRFFITQWDDDVSVEQILEE